MRFLRDVDYAPEPGGPACRTITDLSIGNFFRQMKSADWTVSRLAERPSRQLEKSLGGVAEFGLCWMRLLFDVVAIRTADDALEHFGDIALGIRGPAGKLPHDFLQNVAVAPVERLSLANDGSELPQHLPQFLYFAFHERVSFAHLRGDARSAGEYESPALRSIVAAAQEGIRQ